MRPQILPPHCRLQQCTRIENAIEQTGTIKFIGVSILYLIPHSGISTPILGKYIAEEKRPRCRIISIWIAILSCELVNEEVS